MTPLAFKEHYAKSKIDEEHCYLPETAARKISPLDHKNKTVQIETRLSEYGGNKKAVRTDGLLANYQN